MKKRLTMIFAILFIFSTLYTAKESKAVYLSTGSNKIENGSDAKIDLYFYYGKESAKWSVSNKKAFILSKGKKWCKIKAKKTGTTYVKCKIGKKTYKKKIMILPKSKVTYENYLKIEQGMDLFQVEEILGSKKEVYRSYSHTDAEYRDYYQYYLEDGSGSMWEDYLYHEQTEYKWVNPWKNKTIYCTFNDGVLVRKDYH